MVQQRFSKAASIKYFNTEIGKISRIKGIEKVHGMKGIINFHMEKTIGDETKNITSSNDRIGYVISQASNSFEAISFCDEALKQVEFEFEKN
jgi:hypothetical protein